MPLPLELQRHCTLPADRLQFLPPDRTIDPKELPDGVVFVLARWSGESHLAFRALNQALALTNSAASLVLSIADADAPTAEAFIREQGDRPGGRGESYWIRSGRVVGKLHGYTEQAIPVLVSLMERLDRS